jgi:hypothetical protein
LLQGWAKAIRKIEKAMWFEKLPEQCPPIEATIPDGEFYRLCATDAPICSDFWSHRKKSPSKIFKPPVPECTACAVSVFSEIAELEKLKLMKLHREKTIVVIKLTKDSGSIQQTGSKRSHYSWWRSAAFDPLPNSAKVE